MPVTSPPTRTTPPTAEANDSARNADVLVRCRRSAPLLPPVQQLGEPATPSSAPLPSIADFNERLLNCNSTKLDDLLQSLNMTKEQAEHFLQSPQYQAHRAIKNQLITQQLQIQAQDHVKECIEQLTHLAHAKNPTIARLAISQLLAYAHPTALELPSPHHSPTTPNPHAPAVYPAPPLSGDSLNSSCSHPQMLDNFPIISPLPEKAMATKFDPAARYPSMKPIHVAPKMWLFNGIGTRVYGMRDRDPEFGAYITTLCFCFLFIPLFCIRAYRVIRNKDTYYFLGKESLSATARAWNMFLLLAIATGISATAVGVYTSTPAYKAQAKMAQARDFAGKGNLTSAARIYQQLALAGAEQSANAADAMKDLVDMRVMGGTMSDAAGVFEAAGKIATRPGSYSASELVAHGLKLAADKGGADPKGALALLDSLRPLALDTRPVDAARLPLLEKWVETDSAAVEPRISLAALLDQQNEVDRAKKILEPVKDKLPDTDGARVLGLIYAHEGNYDAAYALLGPYVKPRMEQLHGAEKNTEMVIQSAWDREIQLLRDNKGPQAFYEQIQRASEAERDGLVRTYVQGKLKDDPAILAADDQLSRASAVVPVTLELGIVMLRQAEAMPQGNERKQRLEASKDVFLSIRDAAGQSDEYRLFMGQVYYWLGDQAEGRKLFDEFLKAQGRSARALVIVAASLRDIGIDTEARTLAEEAYNKAAKSEERIQAASIRAVLHKDNDDEITWLQRSGAESPDVRARLATAMGDKALAEGRDAEAKAHFQTAIDAMHGVSPTATTHNQLALTHYSLYMASGDKREIENCLNSIQQAVTLSPSDPILIYNSAMITIQASLADILSGDIDLRALHTSGSVSLLSHLYADPAGRADVVKRLTSHTGIVRGLAYLEKSMTLSPKSARAYTAAFEIYQFTRNESAIRELEARMRAADLDTSDDVAEFKEHLAGTRDAQNGAAAATALKRAQDGVEVAKGGPKPQASVALAQVSRRMMAADFYTHNVNPDEMVKAAEEAVALHDTQGTRSALENAYLFRADKHLRAASGAYAEFARAFDRPFGFYSTIILAMNHRELGETVRKDPDVQKVVGLLVKDTEVFPELSSGSDWAILHAVNNPEAAKVEEAFRKDPVRVAENNVELLLAPANPSILLHVYWQEKCLNHKEQAAKLLKQIRDLGVPLSFEP